MNKFIKLIRHLSLLLVFVSIFLIMASVLTFNKYVRPSTQFQPRAQIKIKSIDTMKYSRDLARKGLNDKSFDSIIENQIASISGTGATHVAIGTPYDREFIPILTRWVETVRRYHLNVWFRGNFSGWEKWFGYESVDRKTHISNTESFILGNPDMFADGDIFTSCTECENGGPGDPRSTGDKAGFRNFLISEKRTSEAAFAKINKKVESGYFSMNYDVARLIMDRPTTASLGGIVVIDHYIKSPEILKSDIESISQSSGGKVVLGEIGPPIPDIHGNMTDTQQAEWLQKTLRMVWMMPEVVGINYWVGYGGSTAVWSENGKPKESVTILTNFYKK